ncbi:uncharacterized protein PADG_03297 [Paracoccidioides brasiliensis Pb18]|uniref:MYND-type domain-containing protein n=1 Tax=Paracoccidioides brasiliensis (strain Pb18) TaxID=502780 RepID=C1G7Z2_PARBD|nr:uncharacterized protein PADG_03297 [Paracoccidioides brasiliensis Pb18]EEH47199.2 hypothetical protein PADG_03297 [Paracoccidioides brasiliensis Pb18]
MAAPVPLNLFSFFHAIGSTPALNLTQDIPHDESASLLLLGCGDVRHILFTCFMNSSSEPRALDFTCCDSQSAVIARNVLLFTLILDCEDTDTLLLWNIYYHLFIDDKSLGLLESQIKKLCRLSNSLRHWHRSKYGRLLRFCDSKTLALVGDVWYSYIHASDKVLYVTGFRSAIQACLEVKAATLGPGIEVNGARSAAPNAAGAIRDLPGLHSRYWKNGSTSNDPKASNVHANPTLAPLENDPAMLYYAIDPLHGFHLVTAYTSIGSESPFCPKETTNSHAHRAVETARLQFKVWCQSFKDGQESCTVRFFSGEALAFCHTLQHMTITKETSANWFRTPYHFDTFFLDAEDYAPNGPAPLAFDVIDTSSLIDDLGGINIFIAARPLLHKKTSSTIYAESLIKWVTDVDLLLDDLFAGHFPTVSILLGVFPVQYWTNSSAVANSEEQFIEDMHKCPMGHVVSTRSIYSRTMWKHQSPTTNTPGSSSCQLLHFDPEGLSQVLFSIYLKMYLNEDVKLTLGNPTQDAIQRNSCIRYHRGSFARFLEFVQKRVDVDWDKTMSTLITLIEGDKVLLVGPNFMHELFAHLHLLGVHSNSSLTRELVYNRASHDFRAWKDMPQLASVTVEVPRAKLSIFTKLSRAKLGTPYINGFISKRMAWKNLFAVVQLGFGQVVGYGARHNDDFAVTVVEDHSGWKGKSSLIVSFIVPSWILLLEPENTMVGISLYNTPLASMTFGKTLGMDLTVFSADLGNESAVYISKQRPNNAGMPRVSMPPPGGGEEPQQNPGNVAFHTTLKAEVGVEKGIITGFVAHIDFLSSEAKEALKREKMVELIQPSPCSLGAIVENKSLEIVVNFPAPVLKAKSKIRVARTSSYLEIVAWGAENPDRQGFPDYVHPTFLGKNGEPVVWNIPYLNPNRLPPLDPNGAECLGWLVSHASMMFSVNESRARHNLDVNGAKAAENIRLCFKDTLFSMVMSFAGIQGPRRKVFGLSNDKIGLQVLFFNSSIRIDMSNHTVALDVAIITLPPEMGPQMWDFVKSLKTVDFATIAVDEGELKLWKRVLPAFVERCKDWRHKSTCEYKSESRIPLSVEGHKPVLCSCGNGILPPSFISGLDMWDAVSKHAVRGLVPLLFTLPYSDSKCSLVEVDKFRKSKCEACGAEKSVHGRALLSCAQCLMVRYCSSKCQRTHWKVHRKSCMGRSGGGDLFDK